MTDWYLTDDGLRAHQRRDCPGLTGATVTGTIPEADIDDEDTIRKCCTCGYTAPTLAEDNR